MSGEDPDSSNGAYGFGSNSGRSFAHRPSTWHRTVLETVGTFFVLAGIAVGILTIRFALVLIHGVMH